MQIPSSLILRRTDHLAVKSRAASYKSHTHSCLKPTGYHGYHDIASLIYSPVLYILLSRRIKGIADCEGIWELHMKKREIEGKKPN